MSRRLIHERPDVEASLSEVSAFKLVQIPPTVAQAAGRVQLITGQGIQIPGRAFSLTRVSRGNWTSFELFLGPFRTWKQADWDVAIACN